MALAWTAAARQRLVRLARAAGDSVRYRGGILPALRALAGSMRRGGGAMLLAKLRMHTSGAAFASRSEQARRYRAWMRAQDRVDREARRSLAATLDHWTSPPAISVLVPAGPGARGQALARSIASVRRQAYPRWELWLPAAVGDASVPADAPDVLSDARIRTVAVPPDASTGAVLAAQIAAAGGDFVVILCGGDQLHPMALYWMAVEVERHPDASLVYPDEDSIDDAGRRFDPYFKCEFNYELLLAQDMVSRGGAFRRALLAEMTSVPGNPSSDAAYGHDLALRMVERSRPEQIRHLPKVLYHRHSAEAAGDEQGRASRSAAGRRVVQEHLSRMGVQGDVTDAPDAPGMYRVRFPVPSPAPDVEIIIPTRDQAGLLENCVRSVLERTDYPAFRLCIVDNGSTEARTLALFARWQAGGRVRILRDERPFNFSALNNAAVYSSSSELVCLLNNDVEVLNADWLDEMVSHAVRPGVGCVGARLWYPDDTLQHGGVILGLGGVAGHAHKHLPRGSPGYFGRAVLLQSVSAVTAACLLVRRQTYRDVGGFDESLAVAFNDVDFCLRVRAAGLRNIWTPYAELYHHESLSRGREDSAEKRLRFRQEEALMQRRWGEALLRDPAYSPNLTMIAEDFSIAPAWRLPADADA